MKTITRATVFIAILLLTQYVTLFFAHKAKATTYDVQTYPENKCLDFTVADQRIDCGYSAIFQAATLTIEAWVKPKYNVQIGSDSPSSYGHHYGCIVTLRQAGTWNSGWYFGFDYATGFLFFTIDSNPIPLHSNSCNWYNDSWYYVAVTYDPALPQDNIVFYVNGTVNSHYNISSAIVYNNPQLNIGMQSGNPGNAYLGLIDEVRIWNASRTQTEIQSTWNRTLNDPTETANPNLVGYWRFDNLIHGNYPDYSIYSNDAVPAVAPEQFEPGAPIVPEFSPILVMLVLATSSLSAILLRRRLRKVNPASFKT